MGFLCADDFDTRRDFRNALLAETCAFICIFRGGFHDGTVVIECEVAQQDFCLVSLDLISQILLSRNTGSQIFLTESFDGTILFYFISTKIYR